MAKRKFREEQILTVMKQLEAGRTAAEMAREVGVSTVMIYSWKASRRVRFNGGAWQQLLAVDMPEQTLPC